MYQFVYNLFRLKQNKKKKTAMQNDIYIREDPQFDKHISTNNILTILFRQIKFRQIKFRQSYI